ncbi:(2Fe-2S) ferredoxin domain-containing protein [Bdellovibrionota bacterium FG-1]
MTEKIRYKTHYFVCNGKNCAEKGKPEEVKKFLKNEIYQLGLKDEMRACTCSCLNYCEQGPNIVVYPEGKLYTGGEVPKV